MPSPASFQELYAIAVARKGGAAKVEALLPEIPDQASLSEIPDDRWLADMTKRVFQAGFNWSVIEKKWPGFEEAFEGFEVGRWTLMSDEDLDRLLKDTRIVRHAKKILSVRDNAVFIADLAAEHGGAGKFFADWPLTDHVGLITLLKKRATRLGGTTGPYFLRGMGRDGFILTDHVSKALVREGVVAKAPSSQKDLAAVQEAFNAWRTESGRPLAHISRVLALTVDA